jgi:death-on-curing protein
LRRAIIAFHDYTIERHGGLPGIQDADLLDYSISKPWMTAFGSDLFETPYQKAAVVAEAIVRNHVFNDANHRTALAATRFVLAFSDLTISASPDEEIQVIRDVEQEIRNLQSFSQWIEAHSLPRQDFNDN